MELLLQNLPSGQRREVLGDANPGLLEAEQGDVLVGLARAEDQAERRLLSGPALVGVEPPKIELHLSLVGGLEATELEVDGDEPPKRPVIEEQVDV